MLVGDPLQFLPVGRAGMFDWLVEHGPTIELDRIHRFTEAWERDASLALRTGQVDALALYEQHGRLHEGEPGEIDLAQGRHWLSTVTQKGKVKRFGRSIGRRDHVKKAYVALKPGQELNFSGEAA